MQHSLFTKRLNILTFSSESIFVQNDGVKYDDFKLYSTTIIKILILRQFSKKQLIGCGFEWSLTKS